MTLMPTNRKNQGCDPISSKCVIWQGPNLECIDLCTGDSVSDVVAKLATELCAILDDLNISSYELSCLDITGCDPKDFKELIQLLIDRICVLEGIDSGSPSGSNGCPDCVVNISSCFYYNNELGDQQTTMQLQDYVTAIGNRLCNLISGATTTSDTLEAHDTRITDVETRTTSLEEKTKSSESNTLTPSCILNKETSTLSVVVSELEKKYCELVSATGEPSSIYTSLLRECANLSNANQLAGNGNMASIKNWKDDVQSFADGFNNMWLTICDMRAAIRNILANCCPSACDDVSLTLSAELNNPNDLRLFFTGEIPSNFVNCNPTGTIVTIEDQSGGKHVLQVDVISNLNNSLGYQIDLTTSPVNSAEDLDITANTCFTDPETGTQCQSELTYFYSNTSICPSVSLTPTESSIPYSFNWYDEAASFTVELYDSSGSSLISSQEHSVTGAATITGSFTGLTAGTNFRVRLKVTVDSNTTTCSFATVTTTDTSCLPPSDVTATIN